MRDETLERLYYTIQVLQNAYPGELTYQDLSWEISEITREKGPAKRTMIRDIERLQRQGYDIHLRMEGKFQMISLAPGEKDSDLKITDIQILGLSLAQELMEPLRGTVFWNGIRALWNEIIRRVPQQTQQHFRRRRRQVIVRGAAAKSYAEKAGILGTLYDAQLSHREVEIVYTKPGGHGEPRTVRPYCTAFFDGSIYVVAEDADIDELRTFKLDRIERASRCDRFFSPREDFDAQEFFSASLSVFGRNDKRLKPKKITAKILHPRAASLLAERPIHPDQTIELTETGEYYLTIPSVFEDELIRAALPFRDEIEIVSPKSCRAKMERTLRAMLGRYGK